MTLLLDPELSPEDESFVALRKGEWEKLVAAGPVTGASLDGWADFWDCGVTRTLYGKNPARKPAAPCYWGGDGWYEMDESLRKRILCSIRG